MKQSRRKELKTNELSVYLQRLAEAVQANANYILAGVVAVLVILAVTGFIQRQRRLAQEEAWRQYISIREQSVIPTTQVAEEISVLAEAQKNNPALGPRTLELMGDIHFSRAVTMPEPADPEKRRELYRKAAEAYREVLKRFGSSPEVAARARMSLAAALESLLILGEGDAAEIRRLYQEVIDSKASGFVADARNQLDTLDRRLAELRIVATRPAETTTADATLGPPPPGPPVSPPAPSVVEEPLPAVSAEGTPAAPSQAEAASSAEQAVSPRAAESAGSDPQHAAPAEPAHVPDEPPSAEPPSHPESVGPAPEPQGEGQVIDPPPASPGE